MERCSLARTGRNFVYLCRLTTRTVSCHATDATHPAYHAYNYNRQPSASRRTWFHTKITLPFDSPGGVPVMTARRFGTISPGLTRFAFNALPLLQRIGLDERLNAAQGSCSTHAALRQVLAYVPSTHSSVTCSRVFALLYRSH